MATPFHTRYLGNAMRSDPFLPLGAGDEETRKARVREAAERKVPAALMQVLREQNAGHPQRDAHLERLAAGGAALVVTGQQIGLFLGPLYTLAKAASAVAWARQMERETGVPCVPLFWLQTEDHDFAEIASCSVPRASDLPPLTLTLADPLGGARVSVAQRVVQDAPIAALAEALGDKPHAPETLALIEAAYQPGVPLARAFAQVLQALFADQGLLVLDPRHEAVAALAAPVIARSLQDAARIDAVLHARCEALTRDGFDLQIHPRAGTLLAFVHRPDAHGERMRAKIDEAKALLDLLARDPLRFSTSALLRPIVQDTLLPTALYVGGPAEIAYFAQASALYPLFDLPQPLVALRGRIRLLTPRIVATLNELGLLPADLDASEAQLQSRLLKPVDDAAYPNASWLAPLDALLAGLRQTKHVEKTKRSLHHSLALLERRMKREAFAREATLKRRLTRVQAWLRPAGQPQERVHAFMAFSAQVGKARLIERILASVDPLAPRLENVLL